MRIAVTNAQCQAPVPINQVTRLARCTARRLGIRTNGILTIAFIGMQRMRRLNRETLHHDWTTDVLTFRYDDAPLVGDILIAPAVARTYAKEHGIPYQEELSRYVVHGLLHWVGHEDKTPAQQKRMRVLEDQLLRHCGMKSPNTKFQTSNNHQ